jgi:hypothetical protein
VRARKALTGPRRGMGESTRSMVGLRSMVRSKDWWWLTTTRPWWLEVGIITIPADH